LPESPRPGFLARMGSIRLDTLVDYDKHGYDLDIMCRTCGHKRIIVPGYLFAGGLLCSIRELEKRLRCTRCRGRNAVVCPTSAGPSGGRRRGKTWKDRIG